PSRELDGAIGAAFRPGWEAHPLAPGAIRETWVGINAARKATGCPRYTTSLDAAASLMPEGWRVCLDMSIADRCSVMAMGPKTHRIPTEDGGWEAGVDWCQACVAPTELQARVAAALLASAADMEASDA
ncbi:MAG TPA: hypothetical protein VGN96_10405, partial [Roseococcus sp.]|nr:hypothetical protein [Roseococcus sp.]